MCQHARWPPAAPPSAFPKPRSAPSSLPRAPSSLPPGCSPPPPPLSAEAPRVLLPRPPASRVLPPTAPEPAHLRSCPRNPPQGPPGGPLLTEGRPGSPPAALTHPRAHVLGARSSALSLIARSPRLRRGVRWRDPLRRQAATLSGRPPRGVPPPRALAPAPPARLPPPSAPSSCAAPPPLPAPSPAVARAPSGCAGAPARAAPPPPPPDRHHHRPIAAWIWSQCHASDPASRPHLYNSPMRRAAQERA